MAGSDPAASMDICVVCFTVESTKKQVRKKKYKERTREGIQGEKKFRWDEILRTRPDRPWGPPSLLQNGYRVSTRGVKWSGTSLDHPLTSSAEDKEKLELCLYSLFGPSWPVIERNLAL